MVSSRKDGFGTCLRLLGGFELRVEGTAVTVPTASERIVAFLALHDGQASRPLVAGTLWPNAPEDKSRGSLRSAIWRLQVVAKGVVQATTTNLRLAASVRVDIDECRDLAARSAEQPKDCTDRDARMLCAMLSADLLPGWYEDWVILESERWRQVRLHDLETVARRLIDVGRYADAVLVALEAKDAEPLRESARAVLIEAHLRQGNRNEALRQYETYRKVMAEELGLEPTGRLHQLVEGLEQVSPEPAFR